MPVALPRPSVPSAVPEPAPLPAAAAPPPPLAPLDGELVQPLLRALADPIRLRVIQSLSAGERCVCELTAELGLAQSRLSFHLRVLRDAGLIAPRQQGRWIYYSLRPAALEQLRHWLGRLADGCTTPAPPCS